MVDVTLFVLDMHDFNVILDKDWLATNNASINCSHKELVFKSPTNVRFKLLNHGT